jgi:hypothetical protein
MKIENIKIGSTVRFVNDTNLYAGLDIKKPVLYGYYKVRGFSAKGFYLEGIENAPIKWVNEAGESHSSEPGFGAWRFEPVADSVLSREDLAKEAKVEGIKIKVGDYEKV